MIAACNAIECLLRGVETTGQHTAGGRCAVREVRGPGANRAQRRGRGRL